MVSERRAGQLGALEGIVHIQNTLNNIILTLTDKQVGSAGAGAGVWVSGCRATNCWGHLVLQSLRCAGRLRFMGPRGKPDVLH